MESRGKEKNERYGGRHFEVHTVHYRRGYNDEET